MNDRARYNKTPDVAPAYYRVADPILGAPARMETRLDEAAAPEPRQTQVEAPQAPTTAARFCSECGRKREEADRFCGGCGNKLV